MIQRRKPLQRGAPPKRSTKPIKRGAPPRKRSAKMKLRQKAWRGWVDDYFHRFGDFLLAPCQSCNRQMLLSDGPHPHHKKRRGAGGKDNPENLLILCMQCHLFFIHDGGMGAPTEKARDRLRVAEGSEANATNGLRIQWPIEMLLELKRLLGPRS